MCARFTLVASRISWLTLLSLVVFGTARKTGAADDPAATPEAAATEPAADDLGPAKPAEALAGKLVRVRPKEARTNPDDLLDKVDLAKDVVYRTADSPVPEAEQFQFVEGVLRTPEKGDARLVLPIDVPPYYRLSLDVADSPGGADRAIGIGGILDGHPFYVQMHSKSVTLSRFYGHEISRQFGQRLLPPGNLGVRGAAEILVGDCGMVLRNHDGFLEWITPAASLFLDARWESTAAGKLFLTFPAGQVDVRSIQLVPLSRDEWLREVLPRMPEGEIITLHGGPPPEITAESEEYPSIGVLRAAVLIEAHRGSFDGLERWAERFRKDEVIVEYRFASEVFYDWVSRAFVATTPGGTHGQLEGSFQAQFAFLEAWLKQKPDSVAARIIKARSYIAYAWDVRGGGFASEVPQEAWRPFKDRLETASVLLAETAQLEPRDVCVYSTMLSVGKGLQWSRRQMERAVERGLQVSKKDLIMIDQMVESLLPRWGGAPGDLGKFASQLDKRVGGDDGLDLYARVAKATQRSEVRLKRNSRDPVAFAQHNRDFTDPAVVLAEFDAEKLRAAIPVLRKRHPKSRSTVNFVCWLACVLEDRPLAKELFADVDQHPETDIWGSRDGLDHWRHWCDLPVAEPSEFLPIEGEEIVHLQAYGEKAAKIDFMLDNRTLLTASPQPAAAIKFWDLDQKKIVRRIEAPDGEWTFRDLWLLDNGQLFVPTLTGNQRPEMLQYDGPGYAQAIHPATYLGIRFNMISDDATCACVLTENRIFLVNSKSRQQSSFPVPLLKNFGLNCDGKYFVGVSDKIYVWDVPTGKQVAVIDVQPKGFNFTRDGSALAYTTDNKLVVWDIAGNRQRLSIPLGPERQIREFRTSLDGRLLAAAEDHPQAATDKRHVVAIYDLKQKQPEPLHAFSGHKQPIAAVAISRDNQRLASCSEDSVVKVWDLAAATANADKASK